MTSHRYALGLLTAAAAAAVGCSGGSPAIPIPKIDPGAAASAALQSYDADSNGQLAGAEIQACPGLVMAQSLYDANGDSAISADEIEQRLQKWRDARIAIVSLSCKVTLNGRPLRGATITLTPEDYFDGKVNAATGVTSQRGTAVVSISKDLMPEGSGAFRGVNYGTYRVEVTHPSIEIPSRYQGDSDLGIEVAPDCGAPYASFELTS